MWTQSRPYAHVRVHVEQKLGFVLNWHVYQTRALARHGSVPACAHKRARGLTLSLPCIVPRHMHTRMPRHAQNCACTCRGRFIMAGDPCQLGPVVLSRLAKQHGLDVSTMERLIQVEPYLRNVRRACWHLRAYESVCVCCVCVVNVHEHACVRMWTYVIVHVQHSLPSMHPPPRAVCRQRPRGTMSATSLSC